MREMTLLAGLQGLYQHSSMFRLRRPFWGALIVGLLAPVSLFAQTSTTPGALLLSATFEAASVKAPFSGDTTANNSAVIRFRQTGSATWMNAYTPYIDRRATIGGATNPYANQARGSIVGLAANTSYDVQVTWTDPDGVTSQPAIASISTLTYTPPTGGSIITVTNNATLASALSTVNPGQTIHMNPGTYSPFTIGRSGNAGAWIRIEGDSGGGTVVTGTGVNQNVSISADFVIVQRLTLSASDQNGIVLSGNRTHVLIQDNTLQNISAQCASNPSGHYGDTGILVPVGDNIFILRNAVNSTALSSSSCTLNPIWDSPGAGIEWFTVTTLVVKDNTVTGGFRDAIVLDDDLTSENVDLSGNSVSGYKDDGMESKGGNVNVRIWNNRITADQADSCIAGNTNSATDPYGPLYVFRNTCRVTTTNSQGTTVFKLVCPTPTYVFHNSMDASPAGVRWDGFVVGNAIIALNNILKTAGSAIDYGAGTFDYNVYAGNQSMTYRWNGTTDYATLADFRTGTGQETHGISQDPRFTDTALHINATSPAFESGVVIANFNDVNSAWPYAGSAPDIGAYEVPSTAQAPRPPTNLRIVP